MQTVVIVIHLMLVLGLIGVVLLQRSEGGGLGMGASASGFLSSRGTANVLTRATAMLAAGFFVTSLVLSIVAGWDRKPATILGTDSAPASQQVPPGSTPPLGGGSGNLLDQLRGPPAPAQQPGGPQVPQSQ